MKLGVAGALERAVSSSAHDVGSVRRGQRLGGSVFLKTEDSLLAREHRRLGCGAGYCPA